MSLHLPSPWPVSLLHTGDGVPTLAHGTAVSAGPDTLELSLPPDSPDFAPGSTLILEFPHSSHPRTVVRVTDAHDGVLRALVLRIHTPDKREYPRVYGGLNLRYLPPLLDDVAQLARRSVWLAGAALEGGFVKPDPFMNLSVTGVAFDGPSGLQAGQEVLVEFSIPGDNATLYHAVARVVRVEELPEEDREEGLEANTALAFVDLSESAADALLQYSLHLQDALLPPEEV